MLWHAQGVDVDPQMLALSTYVGHAMVTNTYWYLTGVPELMAVRQLNSKPLRKYGGVPCLKLLHHARIVRIAGTAIFHRVPSHAACLESTYHCSYRDAMRCSWILRVSVWARCRQHLI